MQTNQRDRPNYTAGMTLADLVRRDHRLSSIFDRYDLNYCCKGARTLAQACAENDLDADEVLSELARVADEPLATQPAGDAKIQDLLDLLYEQYEPKLQAMLLPLEAKLQKVTASHGDIFPQAIAAAEAMDQLSDELVPHLARGKEILLPRVKETVRLIGQARGEPAQASRPAVAHLTHQIKAENRVIQRYLAEIREFTSRYQVPEGVCATFSVSYRELAAFDRLLSQFLAIEEETLIPLLSADPRDWR